MSDPQKQAILIGSGPSLNRVALPPFGRFPTMTLNRSYLAWPGWPFRPRYHACLDPKLVPQIAGELARAAAETETVFFLHEIAKDCGLRPGDRIRLVRLVAGDRFARSLDQLTDFGNVGATSLQILAALGFHRILLIGIDGRYGSPRDQDTGAIAEGRADPDHFLPQYRAGLNFDMTTDRATYTRGWPIVARECARLGIVVRNASPGTALDCFPRCDPMAGLDWLDEEETDGG